MIIKNCECCGQKIPIKTQILLLLSEFPSTWFTRVDIANLLECSLDTIKMYMKTTFKEQVQYKYKVVNIRNTQFIKHKVK